MSRRIIVLLLAGVAWTAGCATGPAPPLKDPAKGEFYTSDEMLRLRGAEADRYCGYLTNTLTGLRKETEHYRKMTDSLGTSADKLRSSSIEVSSQLVKLQQEVRELRLKQKALSSYVVKPGDTLKSIAKATLGSADRWQEIFESNKTTLLDDKAELKAGSRLNLPKGAKVPRSDAK